MKILKGYKTYGLVLILFATAMLHTWLKILPDDVAKPLYISLLAAIGLSLRQGMKNDNEELERKIEKKINESRE